MEEQNHTVAVDPLSSVIASVDIGDRRIFRFRRERRSGRTAAFLGEKALRLLSGWKLLIDRGGEAAGFLTAFFPALIYSGGSPPSYSIIKL